MPLADNLPERSIEPPNIDISARERKTWTDDDRPHSNRSSTKTTKKSMLRRLFSVPLFLSHLHNGKNRNGTDCSRRNLYDREELSAKSTPGRRCRSRSCIVSPDGLVRVHTTDDWIIPRSFNPDLSTRDNYELKQKKFFGAYADIRESRDFDYHGNYVCKRQLFQDKLISDVVQSAVSKDVPWIIFTAGAMGAGKSHVVQWMSNEDHFTLPDIVQIDPDAFKMSLPEWDRYVEHAPYKAGWNTRLESGYMVEMAREAAMQMSKNVWVDGSFRDADWYQHVFEEIRGKHPEYLIAVLYMYASTEICLRRCAMREKITGRHVPEAEVLDSCRRVPKAVELLTPYSDFVAHIKNDPGEKGVAMQVELSHISGSHRLPQLFIGGKYYGGWDEIQKLHKEGKFHDLVAPYLLDVYRTDKNERDWYTRKNSI